MDTKKHRVMAVELHIVKYGSQVTPKGVTEHPTDHTVALPLKLESQTDIHEGNYSITKPFLYMIQTESCIPKHFLSLDKLGDATQCRCDILVLSFSKMCEGERTPHTHIEYLFNSSTTWTTGRNMLYSSAIEREEKYLYYLFLDDDIILKMKRNDTSNPWRVFENSLIRLQPPVASVDREDQGRVDTTIAHLLSKNCTLKTDVDFLPTNSFDAMFSAFHYKAMIHVLPYYDKLDSKNWWHSQRYLSLLAKTLFRSQVVFHTKLVIKNPHHRNYPKQKTDEIIYKKLTQDCEQAIRKRYPKCPDLLHQRWESDAHMALKLYCNKPSLSYQPFTTLSHC